MVEPAGTGPDGERFTQEELDVVRSAGLFETYLGRGWFRSLIIYGVPGIAALLIAAGIFSSLIEVSETLLLYSQPSWVPGQQAGLRVAVMDREGEFVPVTELEMTIHDRERGTSERLVQGEAHGTKAASLALVAPGWPDGEYELVVRARTTRRSKTARLSVRLDAGYEGEPADVTRELRTWRDHFGSAEFMDSTAEIRVDIVPEGGQVASSLPNILYIRTTDRSGGPVASRVKLTLAEGYISGDLPETVETDALGLATIIVYPTFNVLVLQVAAVPLRPPEPEPPPTTTEGEPGQESVPAEAGAEQGPPVRVSTGRIVLPIGPQGIRLRPLVPNPAVGEPVRLRVYSVGSDRVMFTDLYRGDLWTDASGTTVDSQSSEVLGPRPRSPGMHVVQAYSSPVPATYQKLPGQEPELTSCSMSAAHVWVRQEGESDLDSLVCAASVLESAGIDRAYVSSLTAERLAGGGFNTGRATAFLLARLDGAVYPPGVSASSRATDKQSASSMKTRIRSLVIVAFSVISLVVILAFGFLTLETWRTSRGARKNLPPGAGTPISSQDPAWLRKQVFQMSMIIAVVVGTFGLLAVLVMYLRWHIG
jgi:hypothetical protein